MVEIAVVSGKGGAGKTSVAAALIRRFGPECVAADCDVDAANASIALGGEQLSSSPYFSGLGYTIDPDRCTGCGICADHCRFEAIFPVGEKFRIDEPLCERCGLCSDLCPEGAIVAEEQRGGTLFLSRLPGGGLMSHAELIPGEDTSGKLVNAVRKQGQTAGRKQGVTRMVIDGPPGIGCPVIASLSGVRLAVAVIESGRSGIADGRRLLELLGKMKIKTVAVLNKIGIDPEIDDEARRLAEEWEVPLLGEIPFDPRLRRSTERGEGWVDSSDPWVADLSRAVTETIIQTARSLSR